MRVTKNTKVALVCDWLTEVGGAEDVLLEFHKLFPEAPIYTSIYRKGRIDWFKDADVRTGCLNYLPVWSRRFVAPLRQKYFSTLDLTGYDLVISVTGSDAKFIKTDGIHLCYCHVPTQYYWGKRKDYEKDPGFGLLNPIILPIYKKFLPKMAKKDFEAAGNPDQYLTISSFAKKEINTFYKREADIVSPPVNIELFAHAVDNYKTKEGKSQTKTTTYKTIKSNTSQVKKSEQKFYTKLKSVENLSVLAEIINKYPNGFYLNFSRQVNWKRLDIAIKACKKLNLPLVLVGDGPEKNRLKRLACDSDNIMFVDFLPKADLAIIASLAKAFIFPSKEPFGIAPVEALAAGCPVIALKEGGALDYIKDGKNGLFFDKQNEKSLIKVLKKNEAGDVSFNAPRKISSSVQKYSINNFRNNFKYELTKINRKSLKSATLSAQKSKNLTEKIKRSLILCLPLILFFSNFPILKFGETDSMHLKLSLPLLWLLLFSVVSLKSVYNYYKKNLKTPLLAFPLFSVLSLLISSDKPHAIISFGILSLLFVSIISLQEFLKSQKPSDKFKKIILAESVAISVLVFLQAVFERFGADKTVTHICETCGVNIFGFPHPNGFAIEPQFMGSLLIMPLFVSLNSLLENKTKKSQIKQILTSLIIGTALFLTFSRGAIYSLLIAALVLIITRKSFKIFAKTLIILALSFLLSLITQIGLSKTPPENTVNTVLSQLSLGRINILEKTDTNEEFDEPPIEFVVIETPPTFDGYVAESTDRRLELASFALSITLKNPTNTLFGTGLGSAGTKMYETFPEKQGHKREIVQNEYFEALLEIGILGIIMFVLTIITFIKLQNIHFEPYSFAIVIAFAVSLLFFSGFPNALHVYLLPVLCYNLMYDKDRLS